MLYGDYLAELLAEAGIAVGRAARRWTSRPAARCGSPTARTIAADAVVLAPGNFRPATPRGIDPAALGAALGRRSLGGRACDGLGRERRRPAARHRPDRGRRGADPRRDRLSRAGSSLCRAAASRRARMARASRWWRRARICRATCTAHAAPGAGAEPARSAGGARCMSCARVTQRLWGDGDARRAAPLPPAFAALVGRAPAQGRAGGRRERIEAMQAEARLARRGGQAGLGRARRGRRARSASGRAAARRSRRCGWRGSSIAPGPEIDIVRAGEPLLDALLAAGAIRPDALRHRHRRRRGLPGDRRGRRGRATPCR